MSFEFASADDGDTFPRIVGAALILSVLLHGLFLWWARGYEPDRFGERYYEQIVPRKFRVERVEIDPSAFTESEPETAPPAAARVLPVELPPESVTVEQVTQPAPAPSRIDPASLPQAEPLPASEFAASMNTVRTAATGDMVAELENVRQQLLESEATSPARPVLPLPDADPSGAAENAPGLRFGNLPGYSELDDLLRATGPLEQGTAPIFMPGDLLFAYDEAELRGEALDVLRKLGTLIQRNPRTTFLIEGHTDSFGSPEYNLGLSERRALAVKSWLVEEMGIEPSRIRTKGLGSTRLVAPASESIEGQRLNRRVEIVLEVDG
jgi:outer membrane protein OmpA-like peptidoglycan-associated protein